MHLPTPSQSVSLKWFHQCVNLKKKLSFRHPLPTFDSFSFFRHPFDSRLMRYILQKLTKSFEIELRHLFQCCILIPKKCLHKTPFQHKVWGGGTLPPLPLIPPALPAEQSKINSYLAIAKVTKMILDIIDNFLKNYQYQVEEIGNNDLSGKNFQISQLVFSFLNAMVFNL